MKMQAHVTVSVVVEFDDDGETDLKSQAIDAVTDVWGLAWSEHDAIAAIDVVGDIVPALSPRQVYDATR